MSVIDEPSDVKFGMQLGFLKAHDKIQLRKSEGGPCLKAPQNLGIL